MKRKIPVLMPEMELWLSILHSVTSLNEVSQLQQLQ